MARENALLYSMNVGEVSPLALGRVDIARMRLAAETFHNMLPQAIGPAQIRPGLEFLNSSQSDLPAKYIPFVFSATDTALIELTNLLGRIIKNGVPLQRTLNTTPSPTNGTFASATGWTLTTTNGGEATIGTTFPGMLQLRTPVRGSTASAQLTAGLTIVPADVGKRMAFQIIVERGPVIFRLSSSSGGADDLIAEQELPTGQHSLTYIATATVFPRFTATSETHVLVDSILTETGAIPFNFPTPWLTANLPNVRFDQSGDTVFVVDGVHQMRRIERRTIDGWSIIEIENKDGPFIPGATSNVLLTPSVNAGNGTLTASAPFFRASHVGCLFRLWHPTQQVNSTLAGDDTYSDPVYVRGFTPAAGQSPRTITRTMAGGPYVGTLSFQDAVSPYEDFYTTSSLAANSLGSGSYTPDGSGVGVAVRMGFPGNTYTSGSVGINIVNNQASGIAGIVRVTGFTSTLQVQIEVLSQVFDLTPTGQWEEGEWSDYRGWPSAVGLFDGRLWFAKADRLWGSVSDDFTSFNADLVGDDASIQRSIASGAVNEVKWLLGLGVLALGTAGAEPVASASSQGEILTPSNTTVKDASSVGSSAVQAQRLDKGAIFIDKSGARLFELAHDANAGAYGSGELTKYNQDILQPTVVAAAIQRAPMTRIWLVLADGTGACFSIDRDEQVFAWSTFDTDGLFLDVAVLPASGQDQVYFHVQRTVGGTKRYLERLAPENTVRGGTFNRVADSFRATTQASSVTVGNLAHLTGKQVVAWGNSQPFVDAAGEPSLFTVGASTIVLPQAVTNSVVGLGYTAQFKSAKLVYAGQLGSAVSQKKRVASTNLLLYKTNLGAVSYGRNFTNMDRIPLLYNGDPANSQTTLLDSYDAVPVVFPGEWNADSRLCLQMKAPYAVTILGVGFGIETTEKG